MNDKDRERWNKKYLEGFLPKEEPSQILKDFIHLSNKGRALDIAAGLGRNALFLAQNGFLVDAVDISDVAIEKLKNLHPNINPIHADLKEYRPAQNSYDLIVNLNFLERSLFPYIREALKEGGVLIFETFLEGSPSKTNKDFLLRKNELLHSFLSLHIVFYQEKQVITCNQESAYKASLVAIKKC
ncbi:class I SAM-dependent methyltransferase [Sulfurihydrogenibium subterraneum]|uniref:class I SAM-dependent methyltransferase n=1 Tax=Sulfurihydrogenibium subterraneum TaxID=171121 RepID=UPI0004916534|nr:class I SAM-dependent methyltransferase [Sulfurihydrogenibium subterraneum]